VILKVRSLDKSFPLPDVQERDGRRIIKTSGITLVRVEEADRDKYERVAGQLAVKFSMDALRPLALDVTLDAPNESLNGFWIEESAVTN
jgi:hypothetical protein